MTGPGLLLAGPALVISDFVMSCHVMAMAITMATTAFGAIETHRPPCVSMEDTGHGNTSL